MFEIFELARAATDAAQNDHYYRATLSASQMTSKLRLAMLKTRDIDETISSMSAAEFAEFTGHELLSDPERHGGAKVQAGATIEITERKQNVKPASPTPTNRPAPNVVHRQAVGGAGGGAGGIEVDP